MHIIFWTQDEDLLAVAEALGQQGHQIDLCVSLEDLAPLIGSDQFQLIFLDVLEQREQANGLVEQYQNEQTSFIYLVPAEQFEGQTNAQFENQAPSAVMARDSSLEEFQDFIEDYSLLHQQEDDQEQEEVGDDKTDPTAIRPGESGLELPGFEEDDMEIESTQTRSSADIELEQDGPEQAIADSLEDDLLAHEQNDQKVALPSEDDLDFPQLEDEISPEQDQSLEFSLPDDSQQESALSPSEPASDKVNLDDDENFLASLEEEGLDSEVDSFQLEEVDDLPVDEEDDDGIILGGASQSNISLENLDDQQIDEQQIEEQAAVEPPVEEMNFSVESSGDEESAPDIEESVVEMSTDEMKQTDDDIESFEQDQLLRLKARLTQLREERQDLINLIDEHKKEVEVVARENLGLKAELDEAKIEINILRKRYTDEVDEVQYRLKVSEEKKTILEEKARHYQMELENLGQKVRIDFNKVKQREKELEGQLELSKMDAQAQIQSRDEMIVELKRKIDQLEFNMENAHIREQKYREDKLKLEERVSKLMKTLRGSIRMLENDLDMDEELLEKIKKM